MLIYFFYFIQLIMSLRYKVIINLLFCIICMFIHTKTACWTYVNSTSTGFEVYSVDFSPDGLYLAMAEKSKGVTLLRTSDYTMVHTFSAHYTSDYANSIKYSKDQSMIAIGGLSSSGSYIEIMHALPLSSKINIMTGFKNIAEIDFNQDDSRIIACGQLVASSSYGYQIYAVSNGSLVKADKGFTGLTTCCRYANNGEYAVGDNSYKVRVFHANGTQRWQSTLSSQILRLAWKQDSSALTFSDKLGKVRIYDVLSNGVSQTYTGLTQVYGLDWSPDGQFIAIADKNTDVIIRNATAGISLTLTIFTNPGGDIFNIAISKDSKYLAVPCLDKKLYLYINSCAPNITNTTNTNTTDTNTTNTTDTNTTNTNTTNTTDTNTTNTNTTNTTNTTDTNTTNTNTTNTTNNTAGNCTNNCYVCLSNSCLVCQLTYFLSPTQECWPQIQNCLTPNYTSISNPSCILCEASYVLTLGVCLRCDVECAVCDSSSCLSCSLGKPIGNGCSQVVGCIELQPNYNNTKANCIRCDQAKGFYFIPSSKSCSCPPGSLMNNNICHNLQGCLGPMLINGKVECSICSFEGNFQLADGKCICSKGFKLNEFTRKCQQICGDGILFSHYCDDGNVQSGDGCSSECKGETFYKCLGGNTTHPSSCFYIGLSSNFKFTLKSIEKQEYTNVGLFKFSFEPRTKIFDKAIFSQLKFNAIGIDNVSWKLEGSDLFIQVLYNQHLEGNLASLNFTLINVFVKNVTFNLNFTMKSNGQKLLYYVSNNTLKVLSMVGHALSGFMVLLFILSSSQHKMAGVQFIHTYQIILNVFLLQKQMTAFYSATKFYTYASMNFLFFWNRKSNLHLQNPVMSYDSQNHMFSLIVYYAIIVFVLFMMLIASKMSSILGQNSLRLKVILYNSIVFPFTMAFLYQLYLQFFILIARQQSNVASFIYERLGIIFQIIAILVVFFQWKMIFLKGNDNKILSYQGVDECSALYIPLYISCYYLLLLLINLSSIYLFEYYRESITILIACYLLAFIIKMPYTYNIHNITQIVNMVVLLGFVLFTVVRHRLFSTITQESTQLFAMFLLYLVVATNIIVNMIRIFCIIYNRCKKSKQITAEMIDKEEKSKEEYLKQLARPLHKYYYDWNAQANVNNDSIVSQLQNNLLQEQPSQTRKKKKRKMKKKYIEPALNKIEEECDEQ